MMDLGGIIRAGVSSGPGAFRGRRLMAAVGLAMALVLGPAAAATAADELVLSVQRDLQALGYDVGTPDGVAGTKTQLAIAKFEAANDMPVTGQASLQVAAAAAVQADAKRRGEDPAATAAAAAPQPQLTAAELHAQRQACLQAAVQEQRAAQQKRQAWGNIARAGTRLAGRVAGVDTRTLYDLTRSADDVATIANDLGLTQSQVEECM
jgi:peptidoglycan hydrolase-like protein with peptidoglycan-binding domain